MTEIRLVIADVDGTLVTDDKALTDRARRAVRALRERDIAFTITSGRPPTNGRDGRPRFSQCGKVFAGVALQG